MKREGNYIRGDHKVSQCLSAGPFWTRLR